MTVVISGIILAGCDTDSSSAAAERVRFEGRVTDDAGFGKRADIEGAVVTASRLEANGSLTRLDGQAITDAEGRFELDADGASEFAVLTAESEGFASRVVAYNQRGDGGTIRAMPMNVETDAEAGVYLEVARSKQARSLITTADVALHVNEELAAAWKTKQTTAAEIAASLMASMEAESAYYAADDEPGPDYDEVRGDKNESFLELQSGLHVAVTASSEAGAIAAFERSMIDLYTDAGVSAEAQAKARRAAKAALLRFYGGGDADARFALSKQAEIVVAVATSEAIASRFEAAGASEARLAVLTNAGNTLIASIRSASNQATIADAKATYEATVEAEVMAEVGIDAIALVTVQTALATVQSSLEASVSSAGSATVVASAYDSFYTTAEMTAEAALSSKSNAELAAEVMVLLAANL